MFDEDNFSLILTRDVVKLIRRKRKFEQKESFESLDR